MNERMEQALETARRLFGDNAFEDEATGGFSIPIDGDTLNFFENLDGDCVICRCLVHSLTGMTGLERLCQAALQANLFGLGTNGAVLSVNDDGDAMYLTDRASHEVIFDEAGMEAFCDAFMHTLYSWRERCMLYLPAEEAAAEAEASEENEEV